MQWKKFTSACKIILFDILSLAGATPEALTDTACLIYKIVYMYIYIYIYIYKYILDRFGSRIIDNFWVSIFFL